MPYVLGVAEEAVRPRYPDFVFLPKLIRTGEARLAACLVEEYTCSHLGVSVSHVCRFALRR